MLLAAAPSRRRILLGSFVAGRRARRALERNEHGIVAGRDERSGGESAARQSEYEEAAEVAAAKVIAAARSSLRRVSERCLRFLPSAQMCLRVLAARPLRVREHSTSELFGDYDPDTKAICVWMRTAMRKEVTSFGTFLSTLCHELCHHLDFRRFAFGDSWHTRGFYSRAAILYHHAKGTPLKRLVWVPVARGRWRIDWQRTNRQQ
jgi:hypothetical protein